MSDNNKTLNRGLDALLGSKGTTKRTVQEVGLEQINAGRFQPRENFNEESLNELTESIKKHGVLSPILVRELGLNKYEVIAGERRLRASLKAGLKTIPCLIDQKKERPVRSSHPSNQQLLGRRGRHNPKPNPRWHHHDLPARSTPNRREAQFQNRTGQPPARATGRSSGAGFGFNGQSGRLVRCTAEYPV